MSTITGLSHIHLYVHDPESSAAFYRQVFGFAEKFRVGDQLFVSTPDDGVWLTFHRSNEASVGSMGGIAHFGFALDESERLDDVLGELEQAGGRTLERGEHMPGLPYALVADPDGYIFEI